ncbi:MAG TPA: NUDIX domain-containing protein [Vicinamibacterales bacterium]|nr:NUDIX domain-containing protein [Vicinamibacterales bacterium]
MALTSRESAGLLLFRRRDDQIEVLLGHPGGPYWTGKHEGAWSIPKGGILPGEELLHAAIREFTEETGFAPVGPFIPLGSIVQRSGKTVHAWAFEGDWDPARLVSIATTTEWPPRSHRIIEIPELDRAAFFPIPEARRLINVAQAELLARLLQILAGIT